MAELLDPNPVRQLATLDTPVGLHTFPIENGAPIVTPGVPHLKLWKQALNALGTSQVGLERVRPELQKYALQMGEGYRSEPLEVFSIYALSTTNTNEFTITPVNGMRKVKLIGNCIYRRRFCEGASEVRKQVLLLARNARTCVAKRPKLGFALDEFVDLLEGDIAACPE